MGAAENVLTFATHGVAVSVCCERHSSTYHTLVSAASHTCACRIVWQRCRGRGRGRGRGRAGAGAGQTLPARPWQICLGPPLVCVLVFFGLDSLFWQLMWLVRWCAAHHRTHPSLIVLPIVSSPASGSAACPQTFCLPCLAWLFGVRRCLRGSLALSRVHVYHSSSVRVPNQRRPGAVFGLVARELGLLPTSPAQPQQPCETACGLWARTCGYGLLPVCPGIVLR